MVWSQIAFLTPLFFEGRVYFICRGHVGERNFLNEVRFKVPNREEWNLEESLLGKFDEIGFTDGSKTDDRVVTILLKGQDWNSSIL